MFHKISKDFVIDSRIRQLSCSTTVDHAHQYNEIYFMLDGQCEAWIEDVSYPMAAGSILFIPAFLPHHFIYKGSTPIHRTVLYISSEQLENYFSNTPVENKNFLQLLTDIRLFHFTKRSIPHLEMLFQRIQLEKYREDEFSSSLTKVYFFELIIFMIRRYYCEEGAEQLTEESTILIGRIVKYINEHYQENLSLLGLAQQFCVSESTLSRKLKSFTGQNFREYLNMVRIEASKRYLETTEKPITEVAFLCGYNNSHCFGDTFKRTVGISPGQFRKLSNKEV